MWAIDGIGFHSYFAPVSRPFDDAGCRQGKIAEWCCTCAEMQAALDLMCIEASESDIKASIFTIPTVKGTAQLP